MGMFDEVRCLYPLPWPHHERGWQSKDTPEQFLDRYEIRADGTLWHLACERQFREDPDSFTGFRWDIVNPQWEQVQFSGQIEIHNMTEHEKDPGHDWYSVVFWFRDGVVKDAIFYFNRQEVKRCLSYPESSTNPS